MKFSRIPAIVVGMDLNGLGVVRSLAKENVPVIAIDTTFDKPTGKSRFAKKVRFSNLKGTDFIAELLAYADKMPDRPFLVLTQEESVEAAAGARQDLMREFLFRLPEHSLVERLLHKSTMQEVAVKAGMPMPKYLHVSSEADLNAAQSFTFPCILKPSFKDLAYGSKFKKAYRVDSLDQAQQRYVEMRDIFSDFVIQEWIPGGDDDIYFCLQYRGMDSHCAASFVGRKIRSWPPEVGGTASCSVAPDCKDEIEDLMEKFVRHTNLTGFASLEFKRHATTGQLMLVEPTIGRTDYQEEVATLNGVNIPYAAYCHEIMDAHIPNLATTRPTIWRDARPDRWSKEINGNSDPAWAARHNPTDALWRLSDPAPFCLELWQRFSTRIS